METRPDAERELRTLAAAQVERKQDFAIHLAAYLAVNAFLVVIWAVAGGGDFWPGVLIVAWGIGLGLHAWSVFGHPPRTAAGQVDAEAERLRVRGVGPGSP
jgi:hypothetical protein